MAKQPGPTCFADIERQIGISEPVDESDGHSLPRWYRSVREVPLVQLGLTDVARACRQQLYPAYVVPLALAMLRENPLEGAMYDGELLVSLKSIPTAYWTEHGDEKRALLSIVEQVLGQLTGPDDDLRKDALDLQSRIA